MNLRLIICITAVCGSSVFAAPQQNAGPQLSEIEKTISAGVSSFAMDTLKSLHKSEDQKNILMSPVNVYIALALCHLGAAGATRNELAAIMGLPQDDSKKTEIHESLKSISQKIQYKPADPLHVISEVTMANGLFVQQDYSIKPSFQSEITNYYEGKVSNLDFAKNPTGATDAINQWASEKTKGRIPKLYSEPLDEQTIMVLASSLYFNGRWKEKFPAYKTKPEKFNTGVKEIQVQMMNDQKNIPYLNNPGLQFEAISLAYDGGEYEMIFVLPYASQSIHNLTSHLKPTDLHQILANDKKEGIDYKVPRMKFNWSNSLKDSLEQLGAKTLFKKADLSNIVSSGELRVSDVHHAAEMTVDEDGTTATAITSIQITLYSLPIPPHNPKPVYLNRAFMALIYHQRTSTILFSAIVHEPTQ